MLAPVTIEARSLSSHAATVAVPPGSPGAGALEFLGALGTTPLPADLSS